MAEALRKILNDRVVAESLQVLRDLAKSSVSGINPKHLNAITVVDTLIKGLQTGEVEVKIPIRQYTSKHDLDPDSNNTCNFIFIKKRGQCQERPVSGTHRCYKHRVGGPTDVTAIQARAPVLPAIEEEEGSVTGSVSEPEPETIIVEDTSIVKSVTFSYARGTHDLVQEPDVLVKPVATLGL